uniref:Uncharacterized protein n=1 Tax=Timema monikensis TaxID=170555 RepID=A0A7R9EIM7_9NEOP|nr:unnamed protein product [Timema monikensis]
MRITETEPIYPSSETQYIARVTPKYSSPMASLVLTESSQLNSDSQHLGDAAHVDAENLMANIRDTAIKTPVIHQLVSWLQSRVKLVKVSLQNYPVCRI